MTPTEDNSMQGKRVVITGPTSGVGREAAAQLAELGAGLVLGCRDLVKGKETAVEIAPRSGAERAEVMLLDTSSQASIRAFADEFRRRYDQLDVLINNASGNRGTLPKVNSADGIEL